MMGAESGAKSECVMESMCRAEQARAGQGRYGWSWVKLLYGRKDTNLYVNPSLLLLNPAFILHTANSQIQPARYMTWRCRTTRSYATDACSRYIWIERPEWNIHMAVGIHSQEASNALAHLCNFFFCVLSLAGVSGCCEKYIKIIS